MKARVAGRAGIEPARACDLGSLARSCRRHPSASLPELRTSARTIFEWWRGQDSNLRCSPSWVVGLQPTVFASRLTTPSWSGRWDLNPQNLRGLNAAPLPFDHCRMLGPSSGIRTRTRQPLRLPPLPVGLSTGEPLVPLVGFEPTENPFLRRGHIPVLLQGRIQLLAGGEGIEPPRLVRLVGFQDRFRRRPSDCPPARTTSAIAT
jgi:hypothetical protein